MNTPQNKLFLVSVPDSEDNTDYFIYAEGPEAAATLYVKGCGDGEILTLAYVDRGVGVLNVVQLPNVRSGESRIVSWENLRSMTTEFNAGDILEKIREADSGLSM